jgi:hypothetical protein
MPAACGGRFPGQMLLHGRLVEGIGLGIYDLERPLGALAEASPETVAVFFRHQPRLAVHDLDGAFGAGGDTEPATIAFFRIDPYDLSQTFHDDLRVLVFLTWGFHSPLFISGSTSLTG